MTASTRLRLDLGNGKLAGYALWGLMAASTALNAWGWAQSVPFIVALVLIALVVASEVMGMCLAERVATLFGSRSAAPLRFGAGVAMFVGVVAFNAFSGHRALETVEAQRREPYEAAAEAHRNAADRVTRLQRELDAARMAVAAIPADIPGSRIEIIQRPHREAITRIEPELLSAEAELRAAPPPTEPRAPIGAAIMFAIVALIEALKAFGRWTLIGGQGQKPLHTPGPSGVEGKALLEALLNDGRISKSDVASVHANARWRTSPAAAAAM